MSSQFTSIEPHKVYICTGCKRTMSSDGMQPQDDILPVCEHCKDIYPTPPVEVSLTWVKEHHKKDDPKINTEVLKQPAGQNSFPVWFRPLGNEVADPPNIGITKLLPSEILENSPWKSV